MGVQAEPGLTFAGYSQLETKCCPVCGVLYAAPQRLFEHHFEKGGEWYCPNGHNLIFTEGLQEKLKRERENSARLRARLDQRDAQLRAQRGATTRARNQRDRDRQRVAAGVCPCCNRTFKNLARHMESQHPEFGPLGEHE